MNLLVAPYVLRKKFKHFNNNNIYDPAYFSIILSCNYHMKAFCSKTFELIGT